MREHTTEASTTRLFMLDKAALSPKQLAIVAERLALPIHENDRDLTRCWGVYQQGMFAVFDGVDGPLVAIIEASGSSSVRPGWWIDADYRGRHFGRPVIHLLAQNLIARGIRHIGPILISTYQQRYDAQSAALAKLLRQLMEGPSASAVSVK